MTDDDREWPDDIENIVVAGHDPSIESHRETTEYTRQYKQRPEYQEERRQAQAILDRIASNSTHNEVIDPAALLRYWQRTIHELTLDGSVEDSSAKRSGEMVRATTNASGGDETLPPTE